MNRANGMKIVLSILGLMLTMGACKKEPAAVPQKTPEQGTAPAAGGSPTGGNFVRLPEDIQCSLHDVQTSYSFGKGGEMKGEVVSIKAITCRIKGQKKDVPLVGTKVVGGILPTKSFGNFRVTQAGTPNVNPLLEIQSDQPQAFREFLQAR